MNVQRKKGAVLKYTPLKDLGATDEEIKDALAKDEKQYTPDEVEEIINAISRREEPNKKNKSDKPHETDETPLTSVYEEYKVEYIDGEFEKGKKIRETVISPETADALNSQSENTKIRLYLKQN